VDDKSKTASEMQSHGKGHHSSGDDDDMEEDEDEGDGMDEITNLNQQHELRRELIATIEEALREQEALRRHNEELQRQIMLMEPGTFDQQPSHSTGDHSKADAQQMNEHKYLNTLANVHQVRFNLKETQDRYNKMASELQAKLNEKQAKCEEI
jgi:hypothetical protein